MPKLEEVFNSDGHIKLAFVQIMFLFTGNIDYAIPSSPAPVKVYLGFLRASEELKEKAADLALNGWYVNEHKELEKGLKQHDPLSLSTSNL